MFNNIQNEEFSPEVTMKNKPGKAMSFVAKEIAKEDAAESPAVEEDVIVTKPADEPVVEDVVVTESNREPVKAEVVKIDNLRIRKTPEAANNTNVMFTVPKGTELVVIGEPQGQFIKVVVEKDGVVTDGYAMLEFLQMK